MKKLLGIIIVLNFLSGCSKEGEEDIKYCECTTTTYEFSFSLDKWVVVKVGDTQIVTSEEIRKDGCSDTETIWEPNSRTFPAGKKLVTECENTNQLP